MDLQIKGRKALVCGASKGLGKGCAMALALEGVDVTITGRDERTLAGTAREIQAAAPDVAVRVAQGDITTPEGRAAALEVCGEPDILITNTGGPPPGDYQDWDRDIWIKALDAYMLTPIELIKSTVEGMQSRGFGRIINITSFTVRVPDPVLGLSNGPRAGLTGFVSALARTVAKDGVTINNMLPGPFATGRMSKNLALTEHLRSNDVAGRFGTPEEFGKICAFLCSVHAGYIAGQNILIDGGLYRGNF